MTCGTCPEETETSPQNSCQDAPECAENGIEDEFACDIIPWAYDRCPVTCGTCPEETDILSRSGSQVATFLDLKVISERVFSLTTLLI